MSLITGLTSQQLRQAADIKEQIDALQNQLDAILGGEVPTPSKGAAKAPRRRQMSAAGKARIAAAARARWAKVRAAKGTAQPEPKPKKKISAAGKARLSALAKARWAKAKAQGKARL